MKQALAAFEHLLTLDEKDALPHGYLNSARVLIDTGRLNEAAEMLNKAEKAGLPPGGPSPGSRRWSRRKT